MGTIPSIDPATATDEEKLAWCKARANAEPWNVALASVIRDMQLMGIPMNPDLYILAMIEAMTRGEEGVRYFIDGLTLGSVERRPGNGE